MCIGRLRARTRLSTQIDTMEAWNTWLCVIIRVFSSYICDLGGLDGVVVIFFPTEIFRLFRIRGSFIVGLYLRNISNENLGTSSMFALRGRFEAVKATRMRLMDAGLLASVVVSTSIVYYHLVFTYSSNKMSTVNKLYLSLSSLLFFTRRPSKP